MFYGLTDVSSKQKVSRILYATPKTTSSKQESKVSNLYLILYPHKQSLGAYIITLSVCLSVNPSVCMSVLSVHLCGRKMQKFFSGLNLCYKEHLKFLLII